MKKKKPKSLVSRGQVKGAKFRSAVSAAEKHNSALVLLAIAAVLAGCESASSSARSGVEETLRLTCFTTESVWDLTREEESMRIGFRIAFAVIGATALLSCQTTEPIPAGEETVSHVVQTPNVTAQEAYGRSLQWAAQTFVSAQDVLQLTDEESRRIVGRGAIDVNYGGLRPLRTEFLFTIENREGRSRIELSQVYLDDMMGTTPLQAPVDDKKSMDSFRASAEELIVDWEAFLTSENITDADW